MNSESTCPKCGSAIPSEAPRGLCPRCLMDGALASDPQPPIPTKNPKVDELAVVFPQLEVIEMLGSGGMGARLQGPTNAPGPHRRSESTAAGVGTRPCLCRTFRP